ncbi:MAG: TonB-dependent receptor plug domain-containing protein, partial [Weeksellaceae bacterium]
MRLIVLITTLIFTCHILQAQVANSISGRILNENKYPLSGIELLLNNGLQRTYTDDNGYYIFESLPEGYYTLQLDEFGVKDIYNFHLEENEYLTFNYIHQLNVVDLDKIEIRANKDLTVSNSLRVDESILHVPQNIQILSSDQIAAQQLINIAEGWTSNVSGVRTILHQEEANVGIAVRGYNATNLRNGINVQGTFGPLREDMSFVERVEFVKGPAGFMMGNTQPGGFFNIVTKKPHGANKRTANIMMGSIGLTRATLDIEQNLNKKGNFYGRFNLMGTKSNSHQRFVEHRQYALNSSFKYNFNRKTDFLLEFTYHRNNFAGGYAKYNYGIDGFKEVDRAFTFSDPIIDPTQVYSYDVFAKISHQIKDNWLVVGKLGYVNSGMEGESLYADYNSIVLADDPTSLTKKGDVVRSLSINDNLNEITSAQFYTRGMIDFGSVKNSILAGIDIGDKLHLADWSTLSPRVGSTFNIYNPVYGNLRPKDIPAPNRDKSLRERGAYYHNHYQYESFYLQDELRLMNENLRVSGGVRYTATQKMSAANDSKEVRNYALTPRLGVTAVLQPTLTAYALYDESFNEQTGTLVDGSSAKPTYGKNKEIGLKKEWFGGRFYSSLSFYHLTKTNLLTGIGPSNPGVFEQTGESVSKGIEIDV